MALFPGRQARNQRGAIGQLPSPKFSQTYVFFRYSNNLHYFAPPKKYQLVAALLEDVAYIASQGH